MTPTVALLTLIAAAVPHEPLDALELLPLPPSTAAVALEADPIERSVVLASKDAPAIARALRGTSRLLCADVSEHPGSVELRCRSTRVMARIVRANASAALELRELPGLPGEGPSAMPILFHDPLALGMGSCPGATPAARGECQLRDGAVDLARMSFVTASLSSSAAERNHALLRLGDLALASDDVEGARRRWAAIDAAPWSRLAEARRCELSVPCLVQRGEAPFSRDGLPISMAREMTLRSARVRAFRGDPLAAAWQLVDQFSGAGACAGEALLCRRIVLAALRSGADASRAEALAIYATAVKPGRGAYAPELARAAAEVADANGAPGYGAALLSSASSQVLPAALEEHLLRSAELYVAARDGVRARVVLDFFAGRSGARAVAAPRWAAVQRGAEALRARPPARHARPGAPELAAAARALGRSRAARGVEGAQR